ncbi:MAG: ABC transporter substrate-binding protein [Patescibacteria group bacterium]
MKKIVFVIVIFTILGAGLFYFRDAIFPIVEKDALIIVMNTAATDISPYNLDLNNATRIQNIYEGLVAFDSNLKIIPALAVSWGSLTQTSWEFRLREGVLFHDGSPFDAYDVVETFEKAKSSTNVQIVAYINSIQDITVMDGHRVIITTHSPDPLLLSKLTKVFISKEDNIGTGPYELDEWVPGDHLSLKAFPDYWGQKPEFQKARYEVVSNRTERNRMFENGDIDILVGLGAEQALELPPAQVISQYGLEVNFLMFNLDDPLFKDRDIREAVRSLIDPERIEAIGNKFVRRSNQFIAPGVFGYNQHIPVYLYDPKKEASDLFGKRLERLNFDYLSTYQTLSEYLVSQLRKAGFSVKANAVEPNDLLAKIGRNESQLFLIGWQAEDGDAGGFFESFIYSLGPLNNGRYKNPEADALIFKSRAEMDPQKRLALLQEIGDKTDKDLIGIPLFETSRLYGIKQGIQWKPRLDGQVLAAEVSKLK